MGNGYLATDFKPGEVIIYRNGDRYELGVIKRRGAREGTWFINYHTGDTAACTNERDMHKLANAYAFSILRGDANNPTLHEWEVLWNDIEMALSPEIRNKDALGHEEFERGYAKLKAKFIDMLKKEMEERL